MNLGVLDMAKKEDRTTHTQDRAKERRKRLGPKLNEDTLQLQQRYEELGYYNIAEIMFLMANDSFEDLKSIASSTGITSKQYDEAFSRATKAVSNAAPYFCKSLKSTIEVQASVDKDSVEDALSKLINKKKE